MKTFLYALPMGGQVIGLALSDEGKTVHHLWADSYKKAKTDLEVGQRGSQEVEG